MFDGDTSYQTRRLRTIGTRGTDGFRIELLTLCAGPRAMNARISPAVQDGKDDYLGTFDQEIDEVGKSTQHRAMNFTMDARIDPWLVGETPEEFGDSAAELGTKTTTAVRCTSPRPPRGRVLRGVEQRCGTSPPGKAVCDLTPRRFGCGILLPIFQSTIELEAMRV